MFEPNPALRTNFLVKKVFFGDTLFLRDFLPNPLLFVQRGRCPTMTPELLLAAWWKSGARSPQLSNGLAHTLPTTIGLFHLTKEMYFFAQGYSLLSYAHFHIYIPEETFLDNNVNFYPRSHLDVSLPASRYSDFWFYLPKKRVKNL